MPYLGQRFVDKLRRCSTHISCLFFVAHNLPDVIALGLHNEGLLTLVKDRSDWDFSAWASCSRKNQEILNHIAIITV